MNKIKIILLFFFILFILFFFKNVNIQALNTNFNLKYKDDLTFVSLIKPFFNNVYDNNFNSIQKDSINIFYYKVKKGDNIWTIAQNENTSISTIYSINKIEHSGNLIRPGEKFIVFKNQKGLLHQVKNNETLDDISKKYSKFGVTKQNIKLVNDLSDIDILKEGENIFIPGATLSSKEIKQRSNPKWILPIKKYKSRITSLFSKWRVIWINGKKYSGPHKGVDIANSLGTSVYATRKGVVTFVGYDTGYGRVVYINHGDGFESRYAHLSSYKVKKGQLVAQGQVIGKVGNTGRSTGPHLHFEIRYKGNAKNPFLYINELSYIPKK